VAANDTAATWMMHVLTPSPFFLSLMSTMASLPFFFFTLPAGALADVMDRKKVLCLMNLWLAAGAAGLAILGQLHLLNPYAILACIFLTGVGFAFNAPTWASIVPEIVSDAELPSAVALGGLQLNISGIIGPILSGALILLIGADFVFVVNAACFLFVIRAVLSWKGTTERSRLPLESFFESFVTGIRYVRYATGLQIVLARNALVESQPAKRQIHVIADNLSAHKTKKVFEFLAANPSVRIHYTPTYSSWLNQVEIWFSKIQRDVIARGVFTSVKDLARKLMRYIRNYNKTATPIRWIYKNVRRRIVSNAI
jgi:MFS family permease